MQAITYVTQTEFEALVEYSCSIPGAATIGKQWKRHVPNMRYAVCAKNLDCGHWFLGEYIPHKMEGFVGVRWTKLVVGKPTLPRAKPRVKPLSMSED